MASITQFAPVIWTYYRKIVFFSADDTSDLVTNSRSKIISGINIDYIVLKN